MGNDIAVEQFKKALSTNLKMLKDYIPVMIPKDKDDKKIMQLGTDMIDCIINDLNSNRIPDDEIINVDKVRRDWLSLQEKLTHANSKTVYDTISDISETYSCMEE